MTVARRVLVLGGARSGKSSTALRLAETSRRQKILVATAQAHDGEMAERIERHRAERGADWRVVEEPLDLAEAVRSEVRSDRVVVIDCLTLWLSNIVLAGLDPDDAAMTLSAAIAAAQGPLVLVTNEVGQGIVPATPLGRSFRDLQGRLNQKMAAISDAVVLVAAGCPVLIKPAAALDLVLE
jgi:adenosylcobinamide kinase/adenosylcobinamide-phosphate guanylyltransferase